jgi:hypothetical protein
MDRADIPGHTHVLGQPDNWDELIHGPCNSLKVKITEHLGHPVVVSAWKLTDQEKKDLAEGGMVYLWIWGENMPPVALTVQPKSSGMVVDDEGS